MTNYNLEERVRQCISLQYEGESWDFKRQWHDKEKEKSDLLHDIICMSNLVQDEDGIIIIGVDEEKGYSIQDVSNDPNRKDTHELVKFLRDKPFDGGIRPTTCVERLEIDGKEIDVIVVKNSSNVPFYLTERFQKVDSYHIYSRVGDSNTPVDKSADRDKVEKLWKKHFGIDKTALERFQIYLRDIDGWESIDGQQSFFYKPFPEFHIEMEMDEDRNGYEYYCFSQINPKPRWYFIRLKCHETIVDETSGVYLDGGRFFTAVPNSTFRSELDFFFAYIEGTLQNDLCNFFLEKTVDTDYDSRFRWKECVPVFETEKEKTEFLEYLKVAEVKPNKKFEYHVPDILENDQDGTQFRRQYTKAIAITELLDKFRIENDD